MPQLPGSPLEIFPLNLGGNAFGWTADEETSHGVLDAFVEAGGTFVDTADSYAAWVDERGGQSETIIGSWLAARGRRDDVLVATKVARKPGREGLSRPNVLAAIDESLERLQTDHVDLYYAHYDDEDVPVATQVAVFDEVVRSGRARGVGLSNFSPARMREWFATARREGAAVPVAIQPRWSLMSRQTYEQDYAPIVAAEQVMVFPYPALASGFLTGKYRSESDFEGAPRGGAARRYFEAGGLRVVDVLVDVAGRHGLEPATVALAWLLTKGATAPIASVSRPGQLAPLLAAATTTLSDEDVRRLDEASQGF